MKRKVLFVVEGDKEEPRILNVLGKQLFQILSFPDAGYEIIPFQNPIYELYEAYMVKEYDDLVAFLRLKKGLKIDDGVLSKNAFSAIYLVFDYEPHYQKYSDSVIMEMLNLFSDETDLGKLYINYPMVEAFYDIHHFPDDDYMCRCVNLNGFNGKTYKKNVNMNSCIKKQSVTQKELAWILMYNYNKAIKISDTGNSYIDYNRILSNQIKLKNSKNQLMVLSTFPLIAIDYNEHKTLDKLKLKLKDSFILYP